MSPRRTRLLASMLVLLAGAAPGTAAQDVEALGERYGTRPPAGYYDQLARDPGSYVFTRGRAARLVGELSFDALPPGAARALGPRSGPVTGTIRIPVVLGLFADSPVPGTSELPYRADAVRALYFDDPTGSVTAYYREVSGGRVEFLGDVVDWTRASVTRKDATGGESGLVRGTTGPFITQLLARLGSVDWGRYDNDGPDGVPNSGDDDGFVDALAVLHPTRGAECGGSDRNDRIWSHKWSLSGAGPGRYVTSVPAATPSRDFIAIDDYFIQPIFPCAGNDLNPIGVFTHEAGHAFGLPDLYDTVESDGKHSGAGTWDLMSSGSWGCDNSSAHSPCHMGAWSKAMLGWVDVVTLPPDADAGTLTIPPVETSGVVYRVDAGDGSGEYFLLENRQRLGFDRNLWGEGLLVWQIDPDWIAQRWRGNRVNGSQHMGVWLRQADGLDELGTASGGRGDAGDPFPFVLDGRENRAFHAASEPAAISFNGTATGLTAIDITLVGDDVRVRALTRFVRIAMRSEGDAGNGGLFTVDGAKVTAATHAFTTAPFMRHLIQAAAGEVYEPGVRRPFAGWLDAPGASRSRAFAAPLEDVTLVSRYQGREVQLEVVMVGGINGVAPGTLQSDPATSDLWFAEGTRVSVTASPRTGFRFLEWSGALAGQPNPATVTVSSPISAGANFELTYAVKPGPVVFPAATAQQIDLQVDNGTAPVTWRVLGGSLPAGLTMNNAGRITGAALDLGPFPLRVKATDAIGLTAEAEIVLDVGAPDIPAARLASFFLLTGPVLDVHQIQFLDRQGNNNGGYDLGDFRAWVLARELEGGR